MVAPIPPQPVFPAHMKDEHQNDIRVLNEGRNGTKQQNARQKRNRVRPVEEKNAKSENTASGSGVGSTIDVVA